MTPTRQCVACGARRPQPELVRVRAVDGALVLGPGPGRSAYACPRPGCLERALDRRLLARRLHAPEASDAGLRDALRAARLTGPPPAGC